MTSASKLPPHEWVIISLLIITLTLLSFVTLFNKKEILPQALATAELTSEFIQVTIKGAVTHAGIHELKRGARLKDLLDIAIPAADADLKKLKLNSKLRDGQVVKIIALEWITIYLKGAVEQEGPLKILKGTKMEDLTDKIAFLPEADRTKLKKKRLLKNDEVIHVALKKVTKPKKASLKTGTKATSRKTRIARYNTTG
jgi:DNA uptake protein ComE-like DNA-binding protein